MQLRDVGKSRKSTVSNTMSALPTIASVLSALRFALIA
jgi:hypothetical protein